MLFSRKRVSARDAFQARCFNTKVGVRVQNRAASSQESVAGIEGRGEIELASRVALYRSLIGFNGARQGGRLEQF